MTTFVQFRDALNKAFNKLSKSGNLFQSSVEKDVIWDTYLTSFPEGTNPMFRERTEHDCQCCKRFIRNVGRVLGEIDGEVVSVFDNLPVTGEYKVVADTLAKLNRESKIAGIYLNDEQTVGQRESYETKEDGSVHTWNHFYQVLPETAYSLRGDIASRKGKAQTNCKVLKRSITEIDQEAVNIVIELIDQNSLHRGSEFAPIVKGLKSLQQGYNSAADKDLFLWNKTLEMQKNNHDCNIRGTAIGTLLVDLSNGEELEVAVKKYEDKVSGTNYKRTTALVTPRMKEDAKNKAKELQIEPSLVRRMATKSDISVNDVLFADNSVKPFMEDSLFDMVATKSSPVKNLDKVEEVTAEHFITKILPKVDSVELFLENKHESNLVSLVAPVNSTSPCIMKWGNNFSWSYNGEVAESDLRTKVKSLGGRVDGVLRFSHTWNYDGNNQSLMDLHVFLPRHGKFDFKDKEVHDRYGNDERVGWNRRNHLRSGGVQDVDFTSPPLKKVPVENITFPSMNKLDEGKYVFKIHNWQLRTPNKSGFKAEIELNGETFTYEYSKPLAHKEWITVAEATLKNGVFEIKHHLKPSNEVKTTWGLNTGEFHKVDMVMKSPNYWDNSNKTGNEHLFFVLDKCINPDDVRGIYNEFLIDELQPHRKVFEVLASQLKAEYSEDQLSGVGFSSTLRNDVTLRVKGSFNRVLKVKF
ncbi:hypothetical protein VPHG_00061 [Vibrio phage 11895-B1]|uniref:hypothetical protein n=1 Tax=Vibrio phage 11895-B1 TaxID=754075 RepID=UPI0002C05C0B|nr:hypothetical protein VPHG_00061 [Vibrio phage 11895-B1]AGH32128.1 hypothetical protein VPHG_00061 [Vibrio phage 11895-B1]